MPSCKLLNEEVATKMSLNAWESIILVNHNSPAFILTKPLKTSSLGVDL